MFPAPAGINRLRRSSRSGAARVPRASGDKPSRQIGATWYFACSPRQRG
ncbi:hypothetical protein J415_08600 [Klebsiella michiganensis HKOPL1]|nr:hypothetical protein J415_08600 [Klebsiella michiganensis HKOPL1]